MDKKTKKSQWENKYEKREKKLAYPEKFLKDNINLLKKGSILDLACGDGRNAIYLARAGYEVLGVDFSQEALERLEGFVASEKISLKTKLMDLENIKNLKNLGKFDNIIISHYKPSLEVLKKLPDLLNENGILLISSFNYKHVEKKGFPKKYALGKNELVNISDKLILLKHEVFEDKKGNKDAYIYRLLGNTNNSDLIK